MHTMTKVPRTSRVAEAAQTLGITPREVLDRVDRGELQAVIVQAGHLEVLLPADGD